MVGIPLTQKGWDIARLGRHVGWLESMEVRPGESLAMALIGHITVSAVQTGPFANLYTLAPLDRVIYRSSCYDYIYVIGSV